MESNKPLHDITQWISKSSPISSKFSLTKLNKIIAGKHSQMCNWTNTIDNQIVFLIHIDKADLILKKGSTSTI